MSWILVTGGAKGIGRSIVLGLAQKGHNIVVHYRQSEKEAEQVVQECQNFGVLAESLYGDFSSKDQVEAFLKTYHARFEKTYGVVNNVGPCLDLSLEELFQTNFFAPLFITQSLVKGIILEKGAIVNLGLSGLEHRGFVKIGSYAAAKAALLSATRSLAKELAPQGVSVNMVSPGLVEHSKVPLSSNAREVLMNEIARTVVFLLDPQNRSLTGQNIEIDGALFI